MTIFDKYFTLWDEALVNETAIEEWAYACSCRD
jgi:hypothetical protein